MKFDFFRLTFIPRIFVDKDWANLFKAFDDPCEELIKELYLNAWFTEAELTC